MKSNGLYSHCHLEEDEFPSVWFLSKWRFLIPHDNSGKLLWLLKAINKIELKSMEAIILVRYYISVSPGFYGTIFFIVAAANAWVVELFSKFVM